MTVFPCYAEADRAVALELAAYLEAAAAVTVYFEDGCVRPGEDLIGRVREGHSADAVLVLLSPASSPARWPLAEWQAAFRAPDVRVACLLLAECRFPDLLRRRDFFDLTRDHLIARRRVQRWLVGLRRGESLAGEEPDAHLAAELIDRTGLATVTQTAEARDFARCAAAHFDAVLNLECGGRPLVEIAGDLAVLMGFPLDRQLPDTLQAFGRLCAGRRLLVVLEDGAGTPWRPADASVLISTETNAALAPTPLRAAQVAFREALARDHWPAAREAGRRAASLAFAAGRLAEACEAWQHLHADPRADISLLDECCREQAWILEHWGRLLEAERLRDERRRFYANQMILDFDLPQTA